MIFNIFHGDIPEEIVEHLKSNILLQFNRGDPLKVIPDDVSITLKLDKKSKFLSFTIRRLFMAHIDSDTLWSPYEIIRLIVSITINTCTLPKKTKE